MKTPFKIKREKREARIYAYYTALLSQPGAMKTACQRATMKKFEIAEDATLRAICKRVEARTNPVLA